MLIGEYSHIVDTKKRLAIPSRLRKELGERIVLTRGLNNSLFLYSQEKCQKLTEKLGQLPVGQAGTRSFLRLMVAHLE